jgi:hypothetical protein
MVPKRISDGLYSNLDRFKSYANPDYRSTICETITLDAAATDNLKLKSKARGVTVTSTLASAVLIICSVLLQESEDTTVVAVVDDKLLRFLLSVGLRPYGTKPDDGDDWTKGTVACAGGAIDLNVCVPASAASIVKQSLLSDGIVPINTTMPVEFWDLARHCQEYSRALINIGFVPESQRLFGIGMELLDILRVVEMEARSKTSLGRGYTCGVSSVGLVNFSGPAKVTGVYYGTSHARNGVLCLLSCMTVNGQFSGCLQLPSPLVDRARAIRVKATLEAMLTSL